MTSLLKDTHKPERPVDPEKRLFALKIVTWGVLVAAPILYLIVAKLKQVDMVAVAGQELVLYILLVVALVDPAVAFLVERFQVHTHRDSDNTLMQPVDLFFTISVMKIGFAGSIYIFGFVAFLMSGDITNMLYFYPIGVVWSLVHWPKREKYDRLVEKLSRP